MTASDTLPVIPEDPPLSPADRALIECAVVIVSARGVRPELAGIMQPDLLKILPDSTPFHPRLRGLEEAMGALVVIGDLGQLATWSTGASARALWDIESALVGIFASRAEQALRRALDHQARRPAA